MKNSFPISRVLSPHPAHIKMKTTLPFNKEKKTNKQKKKTTKNINLKTHTNKLVKKQNKPLTIY